MILQEVFARFYKSFNYDFLRKNNESSKPLPWEMIGDKWYPFVRVRMEHDITTIVGANESGKSHLLTAIEKGITGENINREDFCRYSNFYTVEVGKRRWPDFGFKWVNLNNLERETIAKACKLGAVNFDQFYFFRENKDSIRIFILVGNDHKEIKLSPEEASTIIEILPKPFRIDARVALPSSVPIELLASADENLEIADFAAFGRENRIGLLKAVVENRRRFASEEVLKQSAAALVEEIGRFANAASGFNLQAAELKLARDLVCKVAQIDSEALAELSRAIGAGLDGHVNGIIGEINKALKKTLNFPHWWVQDRNFSLRVDAREHDVVFTIRDRTEQDYSFLERSSGLKYFLSYYIQYLAHTPKTAHDEILLMDEPDAYLSSQAQQDLLKVFDAFAYPEINSIKPIQVIYVTHSPFLIDRNHSERIRVLEKGTGEEGTRVVRNASRNHYEPLRSALGAFVAETTFIGNCNLMVEGSADQVLLAGAATYLKSNGSTNFRTLDLNRLTIVPAGAASHVPYLCYLARGRDYEKPAVIVLLDSDAAGNEARHTLLESAPLKRLKFKSTEILQIGDVAKKLPKVPSGVPQAVEIEDLVPFEMAYAATQHYFEEFEGSGARALQGLTEELVKNKMTKGKSVFDALTEACKSLNPFSHLDKIGFARSILVVLHEWSALPEKQGVIASFVEAMQTLFGKLTEMQRAALKEISQDRVTQRVNRAKKSFVQDHPNTARREEAAELFAEMFSALDDEPESDAIRANLERMSRDFKLKEDVTEPVDAYASFKDQLERLKYAGLILADERGKNDALVGGTTNKDEENHAPLSGT